MDKYVIVDIDLALLYHMLDWRQRLEDDLALEDLMEELCDDDDLPF